MQQSAPRGMSPGRGPQGYGGPRGPPGGGGGPRGPPGGGGGPRGPPQGQALGRAPPGRGGAQQIANRASTPPRAGAPRGPPVSARLMPPSQLIVPSPHALICCLFGTCRARLVDLRVGGRRETDLRVGSRPAAGWSEARCHSAGLVKRRHPAVGRLEDRALAVGRLEDRALAEAREATGGRWLTRNQAEPTMSTVPPARHNGSPLRALAALLARHLPRVANPGSSALALSGKWGAEARANHR